MIHSATPLLSNPEAAAAVEEAVGVEEKLDAQFVQDENSTMRLVLWWRFYLAFNCLQFVNLIKIKIQFEITETVRLALY